MRKISLTVVTGALGIVLVRGGRCRGPEYGEQHPVESGLERG